ncbi:MAG TPA: hypothetical protein VGF56_14195 [Rhizomicrobium sp.]|jgi:hypothetical protein
MANKLPWTNVVPWGANGQQHGIDNANATMSYTTGIATTNATKTYAKLQPANVKALAKNLAAIAKAG